MARRQTQKRGSKSRRSSSSAPPARRRVASPKAGAKGGSGRGRMWSVTLILLAVILAAWIVYPALRIQYQHERELQTLESDLDALKARNETLRDEVEALKTPEGVERIARENLGMVKPGEQAYVVTGVESEEPTSAAEDAGTPDVPFWRRALDALFGFR